LDRNLVTPKILRFDEVSQKTVILTNLVAATRIYGFWNKEMAGKYEIISNQGVKDVTLLNLSFNF